LGGLHQAIYPEEALYRTFEAFQLHGDLKNGWSGNYLMGLLTFFYHNSAAVNKKIRGALGGNFLGAEVLFTVRIVLRKSGVTDSRLALRSLYISPT